MLHDKTDFTNEHWNGWSNEVGDDRLRVAQEGDNPHLVYPRQVSGTQRLALLRKSYPFEVGKRYEVRAVLRAADELGSGQQQVGFTFDDDGPDLTPWDVNHDDWRLYRDAFTVGEPVQALLLSYQHLAAQQDLGGNFRLDELRVTPVDTPAEVVDHTHFDTGDWNGWQKGGNGSDLVIVNASSGDAYLGFKEPIKNSVLGKVLSKTLLDLEKGKAYTFSLQASLAGLVVCRSSRIAVEHNGVELGRWSLTENAWKTLEVMFTAAETGDDQLSILVFENFDIVPRGVLIDDLVVSEIDYTDFSGATREAQMNGWTLANPSSKEIEITAVKDEGNVLYFRTEYEKADGVVLAKPYSELQPGGQFELTLRVCCINNISNARLSVAYGTTQVIPETLIDFAKGWLELKGEFFAQAGMCRLEISNHNAVTYGNDYQFSILQLRRID